MQTQTPKYQGEPSIEALATGLGTLGRYGDEYMVHAAHGETLVPAEILEANPELKNKLFQSIDHYWKLTLNKALLLVLSG